MIERIIEIILETIFTVGLSAFAIYMVSPTFPIEHAILLFVAYLVVTSNKNKRGE